MVLEKGILALSAGTGRPNEGDFGSGINEIKGRNNDDVEAGRHELSCGTGATATRWASATAFGCNRWRA